MSHVRLSEAEAGNKSIAKKNFRCPVCETSSLVFMAVKFGVEYFVCQDCQIVFSENISPQIIITHNEDSLGRADPQVQKNRLQRVSYHLGRQPEKMLDFGCGRGDYIDFLKESGVNAVGIDQHTELKLADIAPHSMDAINMVEVIEHLGNPREILSQLVNILKPGGLIYIESSFTDFIGDPALSNYVDPRIGHCCIHSQKSITYLCTKLGLRQAWINNNVVVMHKASNSETTTDSAKPVTTTRLSAFWN